MSKDKEVESIEHTWKGGWEGKKQEARNEAGVILWKAGRPGGSDQCSFCPYFLFPITVKFLGQEHAGPYSLHPV